MSVQRAPRIAAAALAAVVVPIPIGLAGAHGHGRNHRVQHAAVMAKTHKLATPTKPLRTRPARVLSQHPRSGAKPTPMFHVSNRGAASKSVGRHRVQRAIAHAAGDPLATISDFKFAPASITIHVGDTITWTNNGPADHTATARDGSFDTGTLKKGQSASHTFTTAGTFAYICTVHPFMHGTVVVHGSSTNSSGSGSPSGSGSGSGSGAGGSTPAAAASSPTASPANGSSLPNTGLDVAGTLGAGLLLVGLGVALSRRTRANH